MKNTYLLLILVAILATSCGSQKITNPYSTSELIAHDTQGIVTLRGVSDEFKGESEAEANAHKKAMQHLFYMGFPGTDMKNPMIQKGQRIETENKAFFDEFYKSGYKQYITSNKVDYYGCQTETKNCVTAASTFTLNYNLLRRDLERNKILNKIGF
ncbi:hypothetical protein ADIWIN_1750 [Winogradskyella psychrotolerans RS-3]|uniref:Lipoprotein n=1 Tax=Winogradskyella psychrotolerans RS-3 TaxID=641526 RepID=S7X2S2_9FLAO|nr:hypothetical protein [Winogradskyella psychrotolerans]EPR73319.1 hypothetical protein ADIWIN_1750 [Winogradskyella psychrotolerans RS-3]